MKKSCQSQRKNTYTFHIPYLTEQTRSYEAEAYFSTAIINVTHIYTFRAIQTWAMLARSGKSSIYSLPGL